MTDILVDRIEAGRKLTQQLLKYQDHPHGLVLALPRGGVPVAFEIAIGLHLPLDVYLVRKLGMPHRPELAMGAIAVSGIQVINQELVDWLNISQETFDKVVEQEKQELERRNLCYRGQKPFPLLSDRTIILVDDGIATGSTIKAAILAIKQQKPEKIVVAVPVVSPSLYQSLSGEVDEVVCLIQPEPLNSISLWYEDFGQTSDEEVCRLLAVDR